MYESQGLPVISEADMTATIAKLALALSKAQGAMKPASFDRENPGFKYRYATLSSVWEAIRAPLCANELAVTQDPIAEDGRVGVVTMLIHSSGEWKRSKLLLKPVRDDPQGVGSALTYARRYALSAMVGAVADEDDDGNEATQPKAESKPRGLPPPPQRRSGEGATGKPPSETAPRGGTPAHPPAHPPTEPPQTPPQGAQAGATAPFKEKLLQAEVDATRTLQQIAGLSDEQVSNRINQKFPGRSFGNLTLAEREQVREMLAQVIAAHQEAELKPDEDEPF